MENSVIFGSVVGGIGTLLTIAVSFTKLKSAFEKGVEERIKTEVANARAIAEGDLKAVDLKIDQLGRDIGRLEDKIDNDIGHVKDIYNSEIRALSSKVESLRDDVAHQHQQLVGLLTKLVSEN